MHTTPHPRHQASVDSKIIDSEGPPLRLYQIWKGRNKFIFGGRFVFGPDARSLFFTLLLILTPLVLFWGCIAKGLVDALSHGVGFILIVFSIIFTICIITLLFLTSGRDPGIIPRNTHPPEPDDEGDSSSLCTDWMGSQSGVPSIPLTKNVKVNGIIVKVKYCQTCMLYRPPRCSHCSICNNCVERFDHHCPWVGQCIGKRNYRYFFLFVSSTTLLCLYVFTCCWINIKKVMEKNDFSVWEAFGKSPVSGVLIVYTFVVSWFVGGLTSFHVYLIATNQTTYENFRYRYDHKMNPYNLGRARNFKEIFCSTIPNSRNNFRAIVKSDPSAGGSISSYLSQSMSVEIPNKSLDIEIGNREAVDECELEDIRNEVQSSRMLESCRTQSGHSALDNKSIMEIALDIHVLDSEFGNEPGAKDTEKINGDCKD